jgi:hypothetical protein
MSRVLQKTQFIRTTLATCDVLVLAIGFLDPENMYPPEQLIEAAAPWFIDAETFWWRKCAMSW